MKRRSGDTLKVYYRICRIHGRCESDRELRKITGEESPSRTGQETGGWSRTGDGMGTGYVFALRIPGWISGAIMVAKTTSCCVYKPCISLLLECKKATPPTNIHTLLSWLLCLSPPSQRFRPPSRTHNNR